MIRRPEITHNALAAHRTCPHTDSTFTQVRQSVGEVRLSLHEENLEAKGVWARRELCSNIVYLRKHDLSDHLCSCCVHELCHSRVPHPTPLL